MTGHTDAWCLAHFHPEAPNPNVAELMKGVRTNVCEFTFTWLNQYKHQTKHMNEYSLQLLLLEMLDTHNRFVARAAQSTCRKLGEPLDGQSAQHDLSCPGALKFCRLKENENLVCVQFGSGSEG